MSLASAVNPNYQHPPQVQPQHAPQQAQQQQQQQQRVALQAASSRQVFSPQDAIEAQTRMEESRQKSITVVFWYKVRDRRLCRFGSGNNSMSALGGMRADTTARGDSNVPTVLTHSDRPTGQGPGAAAEYLHRRVQPTSGCMGTTDDRRRSTSPPRAATAVPHAQEPPGRPERPGLSQSGERDPNAAAESAERACVGFAAEVAEETDARHRYDGCVPSRGEAVPTVRSRPVCHEPAAQQRCDSTGVSVTWYESLAHA